MSRVTGTWTAERVRALPDDGNRYEVIDGQLFVTPAPSWEHQRAALGMAQRLYPYLVAQLLGAVYVAPADVEFRFGRRTAGPR